MDGNASIWFNFDLFVFPGDLLTPDFPLQPIFIGHYRDSFARVAGDWHFTLRDISPDLAGDLSHHRSDY